MRLHILFIVLLAVSYADDHYDFLVNEDYYDCSTVKELTFRAQRDEIDLIYVNKRIENFYNQLSVALTKANQVCHPEPAAQPALFLQKSAKTITRGPVSSQQTALHSENTKGREGEHPYIETLSQSAEEVYYELESLSGENADLSKCDDAIEKGKEYLEELGKMSTDITEYWLGTFLPNRFNDLTKLLTVCLKQNPITQTGNFSANFKGTGHPFEQDADNLRIQEYDVVYDEPFYDSPFVSVALESFELDSAQAGIRVNVIRVNTKGFTLQFIAPAHCKVYGVGVSWFATISLRSTIWTMSLYFGPDMAAKTTEQDGKMVFQTKIDHPLRIKNAGVSAAFNGFLFGPNSEPQAEILISNIDQSSFQLAVKYNKESELKEVGVAILYYAQSVFQNEVQISSSNDGPMSSGSGDRFELAEGKVVGQEFHNSYFWRGLSSFEFAKGHDFCVKQDMSFKKEFISVTFRSGGESQIRAVRDTVFYTTGKGKSMETLTGLFNHVYWATGHVFELSNQPERQEVYPVKFQERFGVVPTVAVTIRGLDIDWYNPSVHIFAENVKEDGFDLRIVAPKGSKVYMVDISWIATLPEKSLIFVTNFNKDAMSDEELKKSSEEKGERVYSIVLPYNEKITDPGIFVGIRGFQFGSSTNARLDVYTGLPKDSHTTEIFVKTWADTALYDFEITILQFEKSSNQDIIKFESAVTGPLYEGNGPRREKLKGSLALEDPIYFMGINHVDFITNNNFRFTQSLSRDENLLNIEYNTWADTKIWQIETTVFYTVESRTA